MILSSISRVPQPVLSRSALIWVDSTIQSPALRLVPDSDHAFWGVEPGAVQRSCSRGHVERAARKPLKPLLLVSNLKCFFVRKNMQEFCNLFVRLQKGYTIFRADSSWWLSHSSNRFPQDRDNPFKKLKTPPDHVFKNYNFQRWLSTMMQGLISDGNALKKGSMFHHGSLTYSPIWSCIRYIAPKTLGELFICSLSKTQMGFGKRPFLGAVWWAPPPKKNTISDAFAICHLQTGHAYG